MRWREINCDGINQDNRCLSERLAQLRSYYDALDDCIEDVFFLLMIGPSLFVTTEFVLLPLITILQHSSSDVALMRGTRAIMLILVSLPLAHSSSSFLGVC